MDAVLRFLAENGAMLVAGVTASLTLGCMAAAACRSPAHRQRICEISLAATVGWTALACIPLPRVGWSPAITAKPNEVVARPTQVTLKEIPAELIARPGAGRESGAHLNGVEAATPRTDGDPRAWLAVAYLSGSAACAAWLAIGYGV